MSVILHHVSLVTADPERSAAFYQSIFVLERPYRPPFKIEGVWLGCRPSLQIHLTKHLSGNFGTKGVDNNDVHFAFRTDDFEGILTRLSWQAIARTRTKTARCACSSIALAWLGFCRCTSRTRIETSSKSTQPHKGSTVYLLTKES